jgi:hypothetical protein
MVEVRPSGTEPITSIKRPGTSFIALRDTLSQPVSFDETAESEATPEPWIPTSIGVLPISPVMQ